MNRHQHCAGTTPRRWMWTPLFAAVILVIVAGCTSATEPAGNHAASVVTSAAAATSHHVDGTTATSAADAASTSRVATTSTRAATDDASTQTSTSADAHRTTTGARQTTTPAGRSASSAAAATSASKRAPATTTTSRAVTRSPQPPTSPVAAPAQGNIHQIVPAETPATMAAAPLTAQARPDKGVAVEVTDIHAVNTVAAFPGEIAGPGVAVTIHVVNSSSAAIDLDNAIVDLRGSNGERGIAVSGSPAAPMSGSLQPGQQTSGVYVFTIPPDQRNPISIRFSYAAETPTVLFVGDAQ